MWGGGGGWREGLLKRLLNLDPLCWYVLYYSNLRLTAAGVPRHELRLGKLLYAFTRQIGDNLIRLIQ